MAYDLSLSICSYFLSFLVLASLLSASNSWSNSPSHSFGVSTVVVDPSWGNWITFGICCDADCVNCCFCSFLFLSFLFCLCREWCTTYTPAGTILSFLFSPIGWSLVDRSPIRLRYCWGLENPRYQQFGFFPITTPNQLIYCLVWGIRSVYYLDIVELSNGLNLFYWLWPGPLFMWFFLCFITNMQVHKLNAYDQEAKGW